MKVRLLRADEINCRAQQVTDKAGAIILLYKDARVDMTILDETYGAMNWQRKHTEISGGLFCAIEVWDDAKKCWVSKEDVGVESKMDSTKGESSDAFKRAGFNWGIGRELYTAPFIFINLKDGEWVEKNGKKYTTPAFGLTVKEIAYNDKNEIINLVLVDKKGAERYTLGQKFKQGDLNVMPEIPKFIKSDTPARVTVKTTTKERIEKLCEVHSLSIKDFGLLLKVLQDEGKVANKPTAEMDSVEVDTMLREMDAIRGQTSVGAN